MDYSGRFHEVEKDSKLIFEYLHPKYHRIPQTQGSILYDEAASHDHPSRPLFLCPYARGITEVHKEYAYINFPPEYVLSTTTRKTYDHYVLPLFWCNNKTFDVDGGCEICSGSSFGTDYYYCEYHNEKFHKECVESPLQVNHPYHPEHYLKLYSRFYFSRNIECLCCGRIAESLVYFCETCQVLMHPICAMKPITFVIDQPKRHDHSLTFFFPKQAHLICNICGFFRPNPTYLCLRCKFVAHNNCMNFPRIIKISRHHHRISYISSLPTTKWLCGVCRQNVNSEYGAYICGSCINYVVHSKCALGKDVCDGKELEGVPEKDNITHDAPPFNVISEGFIQYFLHDHPLQLETNILYDENKLCHACLLPIFEGNLYSCMECAFTLHDTCAKSCRKIQHVLHPHPLEMKAVCGYDSGEFQCDACGCLCRGFVYQCPMRECDFDIDLRCALISEPFDYQGHEHHLFLSLHLEEKPVCQVCKTECHKQLNCIKCDFIICIKCATLPYKVKYKHDKHFLTFLWRADACKKDWCEVCECNLEDGDLKLFYWCNECCTTLHINCLFSGYPYLKLLDKLAGNLLR